MEVEQQRADLQELVDYIQTAVADFSEDKSSWIAIQDSVEALRRATEPPYVFIMKQRFQVIHNICIIIASEMGIFRHLAAHQGSAISLENLSSACGYDSVLVLRVMRVITALGFADEVNLSSYSANNITICQNNPGTIGGFILTHEMMFPLASNIRQFLRQYKPCRDAVPPAYDFAMGEDCWSTFRKNAFWKQGFDNAMTIRQRMGSVPWFEKYPVEEKLLWPDLVKQLPGTAETITIVDIGGNQGVDLQRFADSFPSLRCELILQDLPETIEAISDVLDPKITPNVHDFFTEQPVKGADIYYLKSVLHDWDDSASEKISSNVAKAMRRHSRLLINDMVLSDTNESLGKADMDMLMYLMSNGMERSRSQWSALLARSQPPLKLLKVWTVLSDPQSVIEACLAN